MSVAKDKMQKCLAYRENAENLTLLFMVGVIEVAIAMELWYWTLSILVSVTIFSREGYLIIWYAEETEKRFEDAVARAIDRYRQDGSLPELVHPEK